MPLSNSNIFQLSKKVNALLTVNQRKDGRILLCLMMVGMLLETLSIGMVVPAVALMSTSDISERYSLLQDFIRFSGVPVDVSSLMIMGIFLLVLIYAFKALFLFFLTVRQGRFTFGLQASLSQRLFDGYLHQPYIFHLQRNSAHLVRNVTYETNMFIHSFVMPVLTIIAEVLVLAGIVTVLLLVEPIGATFVALTFAATGFCFYKTMRSRIFRWGEARQWHDGLRLQYLQEALNGVKDVKFFSKESEFSCRFALHNSGSINMDKNQIILQQLPRLVLEFIAVSALGVLVFIMLKQGKNAESIIPTVGLFAAAAFRMMPSANRIFSSSQSLRYALPVLHNLYSETVLLNHFPHGCVHIVPLRFFGQIQLDAVSYCYPGAKDPSISDISLTINRGDSIGFIGGSGAGKSTLVNVILGLLTPSKGSILVGGQDIQASLRDWRSIVGYVPQSIFLTDDTLRRNIAFGLPEDQIDDASIARAVHAAQLEAFINTLSDGLDTFVGERGARLSGGQLQRIGIARALYHDPQVLVLDEATSALDNATEKHVMEAIRALRGDKTILIVAHRLSTVVDCDFLYCLEHGTIIDAGATAVILNRQSSDRTRID